MACSRDGGIQNINHLQQRRIWVTVYLRQTNEYNKIAQLILISLNKVGQGKDDLRDSNFPNKVQQT